MAIISTITLSALENNYRFEAEYYQPKYLDLALKMKKLNALKIVNYVTKVTDGTHFTPNYVDEGVMFFSALNVKENSFEPEDKFKYITPKEHSLLYKRCAPEPEDILLRKVGVGPRWACVIPRDIQEEFSIFVSLALIKIKKDKISPYYLSTFINSSYGQQQLLRIQKGMSQPDLHLEDIAELLVPRFTHDNEKEIENMIIKGLNLKKLSQTLYTQAQQLLERELGLDKLVFDKPLSYEARLSEVVGNNRVDAEFFNPDLKSLVSHLKQFSKPLSKLFSITRGRCADTNDYRSNEGIPFIRIKELSFDKPLFLKDSVKIPASKISIDFPKANTNDYILAVIGATIGKVNLIDESLNGSVFSNNTAKLSMLGINSFPYAFELILRSKAIQMQIQQRMAKTAQEKIGDNELRKILIPILNESEMKKINDLIYDSKKCIVESQQLLEQAKRRVEELIEQAVQK